VDYERLLGLLKSRQSTRAFDDRRSRQHGQETDRRRSEAPSSCNHQLNRYVLVTDRELKRKLHEDAGASPVVREAPLSIVLLFRMGWNHNKLSVVQSLGMSAQNILLAAAALNLKTVSQAGIGKTEVIKQLLGIGDGYYIASIIVGYGDAPRRGRRVFHSTPSAASTRFRAARFKYPRRPTRTEIGATPTRHPPTPSGIPMRGPMQPSQPGGALQSGTPPASWCAPAGARGLSSMPRSSCSCVIFRGPYDLGLLPYSCSYGARLLPNRHCRP
jgi:hypothetical protein